MKPLKAIIKMFRVDLVIVIVIAFTGGFFIKSLMQPAESMTMQNNEEKVQMWTCSMHPQIQQPKPGQCPICFMDLIPVGGFLVFDDRVRGQTTL